MNRSIPAVMRTNNPIPATPYQASTEIKEDDEQHSDSDREGDMTSVKFAQSEITVPFKTNILQHLNGILYDRSGKKTYHGTQMRKLGLKGNLDRFQLADSKSTFQRRITEISWHPKEALLVGSGCKRGDLFLFKGTYDRLSSGLKFNQKLALKGPGAGGAIFAIRFDNRRNFFYTAGLEGVVKSWSIDRAEVSHEFYNTDNYNHWFTSMDVSQPTRTLLAGCTKGRVYLSTLDGESVVNMKLHRGKVLHCEFNQSVPHLIVTSSIDKTVKLWDLRKLSENSPLSILQHKKPVNVANFNPLNNSRLLTSDQRDEVRIYQGPNWTQTMLIKQPHRQFQHITAITASWNPLSDIIAIGKYPVVPKRAKAPPRPIQFFDADTGNMIHELYPPTNGIVSLNAFNPTGEVLASVQGRSLLFFGSQDSSQTLKKFGKKREVCEYNFEPRRGDSDDGDDDEEDDANEKPKRKKLKMIGGGKKK